MIIFIGCFLIYFVLLISTPLLIYPEFFFYPWLVAKGLTQYRDFFDHHGFLTNFLFAPVAHNLQIVSYVFIALQLIQFCVVAYLVRKRVKNWLAYLIILILYISFQYTIVAQQIWYDAIMSFFVFMSWFLFEEKREYVAWIFLALASMIKPTALLFAFPFILKSRNKKSIYVGIILWLIAIGYFLSRGAAGELWRQLILFNYSYISSSDKPFYIGISYKLLAVIVGGFILLLGATIRQKKRNVPLLLASIISFVFFAFGFVKLNLALFVPFFILVASEVFRSKKMNRHFFALLFIFTFIIARDAYKTYNACKDRHPYISSSVISESKQLGFYIMEKNAIVIGNHVELYYFLDIVPPEFAPLHFPWVNNVYPQRENLKGIRYVIVPKKPGQYETMSKTIRSELASSYRQIGQSTSYTIWRYNRE